MCSSANGGLRVGIVCLTKHFSGAALRNQVLLAGANPVFVHDLDEAGGHAGLVDILLVGGGIDCEDAGPLELRLRRFDAKAYRFGALLYAATAAWRMRSRSGFPKRWWSPIRSPTRCRAAATACSRSCGAPTSTI
jgi:hypothetical protein